MKIHWMAKAAVAVLVIAGCAFGGYRYYTGQQAAKEAAAVETTTVERMDLKATVSATGTIMPVEAVEVSSKITARIQSVLVKENDEVTEGQVVAILDGKSLENQRDEAKFRVTNTKSKYERTAYLYSIGAQSQEDLEDAQYNYDTAQSALNAAESDLAETVITSPMNGVVVGEPQTPGTMAVQGTSNPTIIMRIADLSAKQIKAKVDETDIGSIRVGQEATFTVDAYNNKTFTARVSKISQTDVSNSWDTQSSSSTSSSSTTASVIYYYVTLDVDDPESILLPAMTARVEIHTADREGALALPISALKTNANGSYVELLKPDSSTEERPVTTGIYSDEYAEITDGLKEGDRVTITYKTASSSANTSGGGGGFGGRRGGGGPPPM